MLRDRAEAGRNMSPSVDISEEDLKIQTVIKYGKLTMIIHLYMHINQSVVMLQKCDVRNKKNIVLFI